MTDNGNVPHYAPGESSPDGIAPPPPPLVAKPKAVHSGPFVEPDGRVLLVCKKNPRAPKIKFGDFLDLFTAPNLRMSKREPSEATVDIPREFPPPINGHYLNDPVAPLRVYKAFVRKQSKKYQRPRGLDGHSYSTESDERRVRYKIRDGDRVDELEVKVHWCTKCGRWRSRRYHRANPLMPGKRPIMGICSRCVIVEVPVEDQKKDKGIKKRKETEEILLHRVKAPGTLFRRSSKDTIRITRERSSDPPPDPLPEQPRKIFGERPQEQSSSSEDGKVKRYRIIRRHIARPKDEPPPPMEEYPDDEEYRSDERIAFRRLRTVRGSSTTKTAPQPRRTDIRLVPDLDDRGPEPVGDRLRYIDQRIASHPNAWSHGRIVSTGPEPEKWVCYRENQRHQSPPRAPRPPSPPEWYYRNTYITPSPLDRREVRREAECAVDPRGFYQRRPTHDRRRRNPTQSDLRDSYEMKRDAYRRCRRDDDNHEVDEKGPRHVRFEPKPTNLRAQKWHREALEDRSEARRDQHEFDAHKSRIRKGVSRGGGDFELDGHQSEDVRRSESTPNIQDSCRHLPAPSPPRYSPQSTSPQAGQEPGSPKPHDREDSPTRQSQSSRISFRRAGSYPSRPVPHRSSSPRHFSTERQTSDAGSASWTAPSLFPLDDTGWHPWYHPKARSTEASIFSNSSASGSKSASEQSHLRTPSPNSQEEPYYPPFGTRSAKDDDGARSATSEELNNVYNESTSSAIASPMASILGSPRSCPSASEPDSTGPTMEANSTKHRTSSRESSERSPTDSAEKETTGWDDDGGAWGEKADKGGINAGAGSW